jgi:hypothetical protein
VIPRPFLDLGEVAAAVVGVEVGLDARWATSVLEGQQRRHVGPTRDGLPQRLNAVVHVHSVRLVPGPQVARDPV